jgi:hypothetical protein
MKTSCYYLMLFMICLVGCKKKHANPIPVVTSGYNITITTPGNEPGYVYVDGKYTGTKTTSKIEVGKGPHVIGVALQNSWTYLRKEIDVTDNSNLSLSLNDKPAPRTWKALYVGLYETQGNSSTGDCSTHFSQAELDAGYHFFQWSLREHFEKYSYNTMKWETERKDIAVPVTLKKSSNTWYTVEPGSITNLLSEIQPGVYDCVFVFWREREGSCSFQSNYFGLAWTNPLAEPIKTGYVTIEFDAGSSIADKITYYKTNDPGVWVHEWLHTVGENYYQNKGLTLPENAGGFSVHAAEVYQYTFPWMNWYLDFMSGRVPNTSSSPTYLGIGPEAFLKCSLRETVLNNNCN